MKKLLVPIIEAAITDSKTALDQFSARINELKAVPVENITEDQLKELGAAWSTKRAISANIITLERVTVILASLNEWDVPDK